jgi:NADH:ubiquinone oxidoreductase subunit H
MQFGWKGLVPLGLMNLFITALVIVLAGAKY